MAVKRRAFGRALRGGSEVSADALQQETRHLLRQAADELILQGIRDGRATVTAAVSHSPGGGGLNAGAGGYRREKRAVDGVEWLAGAAPRRLRWGGGELELRQPRLRRRVARLLEQAAGFQGPEGRAKT